MNLRIAIKIALGLTVLANPIPSYPEPVVLDSAEILESYKEEIESKLVEAGITAEENAEIFTNLLSLPEINCRENIEALAQRIHGLDDALGEDPFPLYRTLNNGVYTKEIHLPKGYTAVSKLHNKGCTIQVLKGSFIVADEKETKVVHAPAQFVNNTLGRRIVYIYEDTVWINIYSTDAETPDEADKLIYAKTYEEIEMKQTNKRIS